MFGIEQNVFDSPISLIVSIILLLGVINIGTFIQKLISQKLGIEYSFTNFFLSPIIGIYFIIFIIYLCLIFEFHASLIIKLTAYTCLILGIFQLFKFKIELIYTFRNNFENKFLHIYISIIFLLLFLISSFPITHADALDYHFYGGLDLLQLGHFQKEILNMHNNLVSVGEIIIAFGLAVKTEQFSSMIQMASLLALVPVFSKKKNIFLIFILICPITVFLVSATKPQLIFCISTLLIFVFLNTFSSRLTIKQLKVFFPAIIIVLSLNSLAKFSFSLSTVLLFFYLFYIMYRKKLLFYSAVSSLIVFLVTFIPFWFFKFKYFDMGIYEIIRSSLPINIYGYNALNELIRSGTINFVHVFFPKDIQTFSTTYGPLIIFFPLIATKKILDFKIELGIIFIFIIMVFVFGGILPRFLFEGFLWSTYLISRTSDYKSSLFNIFTKLIYIQSSIMVIIYIVFIITVLPSSILEASKSKIMSKIVNGYDLANWTNNNLDENDKLLSTHRSISLFKNKTYSNSYTWYIEVENNNSNQYFNFLKEKKVNRILYYGNTLNKDIYKNCLGEQLFFKKNVGKKVGRNPFNDSREFYDGWIFELKYDQFPSCLSR